nr:serine/threonine-protein kinase HT1-like [Tanacetum cinerariifolium]
MQQQWSHIPKFGSWDADNVPYTTYFENARKDKGSSVMINPNDPEQNPEAFSAYGGGSDDISNDNIVIDDKNMKHGDKKSTTSIDFSKGSNSDFSNMQQNYKSDRRKSSNSRERISNFSPPSPSPRLNRPRYGYNRADDIPCRRDLESSISGYKLLIPLVCKFVDTQLVSRMLTKSNEQSNLVEEDLEPTLLMAILENEEQNVSLHEEDVGYKETNKNSLWYLDNEASNHMSGVREHFKEIDEKVSGKVKLGDGSYIKIKEKGSILIECEDEKQRIISHVYYIPDLKSNLLSLGQFTEIGCKVVMEDDELRLYDMDNKIFMKVTRQRNRLYKANLRVEYYKENGIARQLTAPYSPQQNGVVERRKRTIMSTNRCMMKATNMPQIFWAEAVRHAIYILNNIPTKALEDITPYEAIKQRKPNLENLRVFGCIAYAKVPSQHLTKLDDRSKHIDMKYDPTTMSMKTDSKQKNNKSKTESDFCIVFEYLKGGSLRSYLEKNRKKKLPLEIIIRFALDIAKGLSNLYSKKIIHRDVKPDNMLMDEKKLIKLADFRESVVEPLYMKSGKVGTLGYMAPEVLSKNPYSHKCDVYAFGICLWEMQCCDIVYTYNLENIPSDIYKELRPSIPLDCPRSLAKLMERCWNTDPNYTSWYQEPKFLFKMPLKRNEDEESDYPFFEGDGSTSDEWEDYDMAGKDYEGPSEEEGFVRKGVFGGEEDNIEDVVVVANDLCSSMIQTSISVDFSKTVDSNPHELIWLQK